MTDIQDVLLELETLRKENQSLRLDNDFLQRQNTALKMRCSKYCLKVKDLESEIADMKFTRNYLTSEEAGKTFARELLGKPMTPADIAEQKAIANGETHYNTFSGDDY